MNDFLFIETFIKNKYGIKLNKYFNIGRASISEWRTSGKVPDRRILELLEKEGISVKKIIENL